MTMDAPKLDTRSLDEVVAQTEALTTAYTAETPAGPWRPSTDGPLDFGGVLIRLFGRMVDHLIKQLNLAPNKHQLAFTGLIGAVAIPPRAARAPITFRLAPGDGTSEVPAGTQVASTAAVFETELALPLTRAQLQAVFVRDRHDPNAVGRYADRTQIALGNAAGPFDALAVIKPVNDDDPTNHAIEHEIYVALDRMLALPGASKLTLSASGVTPSIAWTTWSGATWVPVAPAGGGPWVFPELGRLHATTVGGMQARWLRGVVMTLAPNTPVALSAQIDPVDAAQGVPPDTAFFNSIRLDLTRDWLPFGERPQPGDVFYLASDAAFSSDGALVTLAFTLTTLGGTADELTVVWESWDGAHAASLGATDGTKAFTVAGNVTFTLPTKIPRATINGVENRWIRARISKGNYGHPIVVTDWTKSPPTVVGSTLQPPLISSVGLVCKVSSTPLDLTVVRRTALRYETLAANQVVAYRDTPDDDPVPALYLGFDRAFDPALTTLYFEVLPPTAPEPASYGVAPPPFQPPHLAWEYWSGQAKAWTRLAVEDGTQDLARSGLVQFNPATDEVAVERFGTTRHWLRVSVIPPGATFSPIPQLGRIATNTVWASHAHTTTLETLGGSSGARGQVFRLSQRPVLEGQQIEVGEPEPPTGVGLARLQGEEGSGGVTRDGATCWVRWHAVADFWASGPRDRHYTFDAATGTVTFGDGVSGMIPPVAISNVRAALYRSRGGVAGNVAAGAISQLKTTVATVDSVINHEPAVGGAPIERASEMMSRASRALRHGDRAVTTQDFADLALEASKVVARAVTLTPSFSPIDWQDLSHPHELNRDGSVIVVIVPVAAQPGRSPSIDLLSKVAAYVQARCTPDVKLQVIGPTWIATDIVVHVASTTIENTDATRVQVRAALVRFLDPVTGGEDGHGWGFGRRPHTSDLLACISTVPGVDHVSHVTILCPPFDGDDFGGQVPGTDLLSLYPRLLFHARDITVDASPREVP
jgi:uncharacterized phage protein gp47/JayE